MVTYFCCSKEAPTSTSSGYRGFPPVTKGFNLIYVEPGCSQQNITRRKPTTALYWYEYLFSTMSDHTNYIWDGNSTLTDSNPDDELGYNDLWESWKNIIISVKTGTANITYLQRLAKRKQNQIKTEHIAKALDKRGLIKHTITIQIASNGNFVSVEFVTQQIMETFCSEPLSIFGLNITFHPDRKKPKPKKRLMNVSLLNIQPETLEQIVTDFLETYADIEGDPPICS